MDSRDSHLQRLLRMAASAPEREADGAPFGFDTRVLAQWRAIRRSNNGDMLRFVRRVVLVAIAIATVSGAAAYRQMAENDDSGETLTNDYAFADSVIERQILE